MEYRVLGETGLKVSTLGFGGSALGSVFRETDDSESKEVVELVLKHGVNYIDTAPWYGQGKSELVLGRALKNIPRSSYYIATKVGRYELDPKGMFDFSYERTLQSIDESLQRLGLPYVDIIQAHDVEFAPTIDVVLKETLPALQKAKEQGKARFIGVTGYPLSTLKEIVEKSEIKIDTILTYCRYSMNDTSLLEYTEFFKSKGIGIINGSPLSMGLLTKRGPPEWHPARKYKRKITEACQEAAEYCDRRHVDISRLAMHFSLAQEECATCLVSTASKENAQKNLDVVSNPLAKEEEKILKDVMDLYMKPLKNDHWEGYEVDEYKKEIETQ